MKFFIVSCVFVCILALLAGGEARRKPKPQTGLAILKGIGKDLGKGKCQKLKDMCNDYQKIAKVKNFLADKTLGENELDGKRIVEACKVLTAYQNVIDKLEAKTPKTTRKTPKRVRKPKTKKPKVKKPKSKKPKSKKQKKKGGNKKKGNNKRGNKKGGKKSGEKAGEEEVKEEEEEEEEKPKEEEQEKPKEQEPEKPKGTAALGILTAIGSELSQGKCNQIQEICRDEGKMKNVVALLTKVNLGENELNGTRLQRACKLLTNYQVVIDKVKGKMADAKGEAEGQPKGAVALATLTAIGSELDEGKCAQLQAICSDDSQIAKITDLLSNKDLGENEEDGKRIQEACKMLTAYKKVIEKFKKMMTQQAVVV